MTSTWRQWSCFDQRRPGKSTWQIISSISKIFKISDGRLSQRILYIARRVCSSFWPVLLGIVVLQLIVIHPTCECYTVLFPVIAALIALQQCYSSPYPLDLIVCIGLRAVLACTKTFICLYVRRLCGPRTWTTVWNSFWTRWARNGVMCIRHFTLVQCLFVCFRS